MRHGGQAILVEILHPAPVRTRPRRARHIRTGFVPLRTPVHLREIALSETGEGPRLLTHGNRYVTTRTVDGAPWRALGRDAWDKPLRGAPDAAGFARWLSGDPDAAGALDRSDTARALAGTPLVARVTAQRGLLRPCGEEAGLDGLVLVDGRDRAAHALARFVEDDVAIVGGIPMTRLRGPLAFCLDEARTYRLSRFPGAPTTGPEQLGVFLRVDRVKAMGRLLHGTPRESHGAWGGDLDKVAFDRDDDLAVSGAEFLRQAAEACSRDGTPWHDAFDPGLRERILSLGALASIGLADEELPAAYALLQEACAAMQVRGGPGWYMAPHVTAYARAIAEPILGARRAVVGEDLDSLSALAP